MLFLFCLAASAGGFFSLLSSRYHKICCCIFLGQWEWFFPSCYFAIDLMVFLTKNSNIWLFLLIYQIKSILSPTLVLIQNKKFFNESIKMVDLSWLKVFVRVWLVNNDTSLSARWLDARDLFPDFDLCGFDSGSPF